MRFSYPIRDGDGKIIGVWSTRFSWAMAQTILASAVERGKQRGMRSIAVTLVDARGQVIDAADPGDVGRRLASHAAVSKAIEPDAGGYTRAEALFGEGQRLVGFHKSRGFSSYAGLGWAVLTSQQADEALAAATRLRRGLLIVGGISALALFAFAMFAARRISDPLLAVTHALHELSLAEADLTKRLPESAGADEVRGLAMEFNGFLERLRELIQRVVRSGIQVTSASTAIAAGTRELEATATEQVAATNEVVASARQISATSAALTGQMNDLAVRFDGAATSATSSRAELDGMEQSMAQIQDAVALVATKLDVINEKANAIASVVTTITKVADQTNLLSLNAAIEAEKAGQYGQGFSVVAREIRRLADQTALATLDIEKMVNEMKGAVVSGVRTIDGFASSVQQAATSVDQVSGRLVDLVAQVEAVAPDVEAINEGVSASAEGATQIAQTMSELSVATQQTAHAIDETRGAIDGLERAAGDLHEGFARFNLDDGGS